jgi:hypothetical protein
MKVELDQAEAEALVTVVRFAVSDLSPEIVGADNWENRAMLRRRRDSLQSVLVKLGAEA